MSLGRTLRGAGLLAIGAFLAAAAYSQYSEKSERDAILQKTGFATFADYTAATSAGITTPAAWAERKAALAKQATEEQEKARLEKYKRDEAEYLRTRNPATNMNMKSMTWSKGGFGSVGLVTLTIENKNDFPVKDMRVSCDFRANSGTLLNTATGTIFETMKPTSSRTFREFNIGFIHSQAQRAGCSVESASRL